MSDRDRRPPIAADMRRTVRQRCGFGCVICGKSLYQIDHICEWSEVRVHEEHNLTLLCHEHHDQKTMSRLDLTVLSDANQNPYNMKQEQTAATSYSTNGAENFQVTFGGLNFVWNGLFESQVFPVLILDGIPSISFTVHNRRALLNLRAYDEAGHPLLIIEQGDVVIATSTWDCETKADKLIIRTGAGEIAIEVRFRGSGPEILRSHFFGILGTAAEVSDTGIVAQTPGLALVMQGGFFEQSCMILGPGMTHTAVDSGGGICSESLIAAHERLASAEGLRLLLQQPDAPELLERLLGQAHSAGRAQKTAMPERSIRSFDCAIRFGEALLSNLGSGDGADQAVLHFNLANSYWLLASISPDPAGLLMEARDHLIEAIAQPGYEGLNAASAKCRLVGVLVQLGEIGHEVAPPALAAMLNDSRQVFMQSIPLGKVNNPTETMADFDQLASKIGALSANGRR